MNPKINKLKAERDKLASKIESYQIRVRELDEAILKLENTDIVGLVREQGLTADMLAALIAASKESPLPIHTVKKEESNESAEK